MAKAGHIARLQRVDGQRDGVGRGVTRHFVVVDVGNTTGNDRGDKGFARGGFRRVSGAISPVFGIGKRAEKYGNEYQRKHFQHVLPLLLVFVTSGYSQWNIDTGKVKASFAPQSCAVFGMKNKKINIFKLIFTSFSKYQAG